MNSTRKTVVLELLGFVIAGLIIWFLVPKEPTYRGRGLSSWLEEWGKSYDRTNAAATAIRWLRAHASENGIDPNHIGVWGASAGGHLVALLGTTGDVRDFDTGENSGVSSRVQAVCDWCGPTDFTKNPEADTPDSPIVRLLGGPIAKNIEKAQSANPIHYITKDDPPFLIVHGDKDPVVPLEQSQLLADALQKAGVHVKLQVLPGAGHGGPEFQTQEEREKLFFFFLKNLKGD
jgi:dipeptidyl aminopeptidase/acylaminoacyl peptidase